MRKFIIVLFMFGAVVCFGQLENVEMGVEPSMVIYADDPSWLVNYKEGYAAYLSYCEEEVNDTITQYGKATIAVIPVYNLDGDLVKYMYGNKRDTTWDVVNVDEYKIDHDRWGDYSTIATRWDNVMFTSTNSIYTGTTTFGPAREDIDSQVTIEVSRPWYYILKREKPSREGFSNYIYKQVTLIR